MLELIAIPLPGEALMTYCGYLIYTQKMSWPISIIMATFGVIIGITISNFIGKILGIGFFEKHGHYIYMDKNRIDKIEKWFEKYGNKLLLVAYFIPGVRHVTGYFSGIIKYHIKSLQLVLTLELLFGQQLLFHLEKFLVLIGKSITVY